MNTRLTWLWMLLVLALAGAPAMVHAQTLPPAPAGPVEDPAETAKIKFGPIFMQPSFSLKKIGRDDNVFNEAVDPKTDWTATVNMGMLAGIRYGAARFTVRTSSDYVYYAEYPSERSIDGNTRLQFELRTQRLRPWIAMDRIKTHERAGLEIDARAARNLPSYEAGVEFRPGFRLGLRFLGRQREVDYADDDPSELALGETLDATYQEGSLQLLYELSPLSSFRASAEMSRSTFETASIRDAEDVAFFAGIEGGREAALHGYVDVGWRQRTPEDPAAPAFSGLVARASASFVLWDQLLVAFGADREIPYSFEESYTFYVQQGGTTTLTWRPHDRFEFVGTGRHYWLNYDQGVDAGALLRTDRVFAYGGGFGFFIRGYPGTRLGFNVEREVRESVLAERRYDTPRFFTNLGFSF